MLVGKEKIRDYLPQKDPIVMVDCILENGETSVVTSFTPDENNIFCSNGYFSESGLIENMAQTAAAKAGYVARINNGKPLVGFIGALKNLKIHFLPPSGGELITYLNITAEIMNINLAYIYVNYKGSRVAECEMKIFLQEK